MGDSHKSKSTMRTLVNDDFRASHEAAFGNAGPQRGRWIWDKERKELVRAEDYVAAEPDPTRVPVVSDRYMEGARATDGTDIGSRPKRREYMNREGLADASDYARSLSPEAKERKRSEADRQQLREITDTVGHAAYHPRRK